VSIRKRAANRRNARRSTGPRSAAGKARAAQNARRHGLTLPVGSDLASLRRIMSLTDAIAGADASAERREGAIKVALAQADLERIRQAKADLLRADLAGRPFPSSRAIRQLASMGRYERRAFGRRKMAIRRFERPARTQLCDSQFCQNEPTGGNPLVGLMGYTHFSASAGPSGKAQGSVTRARRIILPRPVLPRRSHRRIIANRLKRLLPKISRPQRAWRRGGVSPPRAPQPVCAPRSAQAPPWSRRAGGR
jgi:hypothetical protein